jgi:DnaJ-like protein
VYPIARHNDPMDPYAVLGVRPGSPEKEIAAAYREAAKRWHPDRGAGEEAERRMADINAAYDLVRAAAQHEATGPRRAGDPMPPVRTMAKGGWLIPPLRLALGPELLDTLTDGEDVKLVTPTSTWASPRAILAVTERRLLWLLDDAPVARVHSLAFRNVAEIAHRVRRRHAALTIRTLAGRRHVFHDLRPHTAATIERHVLDRPSR